MANPLTIVCFQLLDHPATSARCRPIRSIIVGTVIIGLSMVINLVPIFMARRVRAVFANWVPLGSLFIILTVALIAFGELFTSARTYEYIGALAPKGQEGLFLGYANLPMAIGSLVGGPVGRLHLQRGHVPGTPTTRPNQLLELDPGPTPPAGSS